MREFDRLTNHEKQTLIVGAERANEIVIGRYPSATSSGIASLFRRGLERLGIIPEVLDEGAMNINSKIANLELSMRTPLFWELGLVENIQSELTLFIKLRDEYRVETVGQAMNLFQQRKIDPEIVRDWIEENFVRGTNTKSCVLIGYPEFFGILSE